MKKVIGCSALMILLTAAVYSDGLPGDFKTSNRYRALGLECSPLVNPSFIIEKAYPSAQYILSSFVGEFHYHDVRLTTPLSPEHSLGLTWLNHGPGVYDLVEYNQIGSESKVVGTVVDQNNLFTFSYGSSVLKPLQFGMNVNVIHQKFADENYSSFGADVGFSFSFPKSKFGSHVLGCAVHNAVAPIIGSQYPRILAASWHGVPFGGPVFAGVDVQIKDITSNSVEYGNSIVKDWEVDSKLGFTLFRYLKFTGLAGFSRSGLEYIGIAAGMNGFSVNKEREIQAAVQHLMINDGMNLQSLHIQGEFGRDRMQSHREHMERLQQQAPLQLLEKGLRLYKEQKYWEAFMVFGKIRALYPDFRQMDKVLLYAGSSLEEMDMNSEASSIYGEGRKAYPDSDCRFDYNLGLLRIHYREKNARNLIRIYEEIIETSASDSVKQHAYYLMGEMYLQKRSFGIAQQFFNDVPEGHPDYLYARYSDAMASYHMGKYTEAVAKLEELVSKIPATKAQRELINRANLQIGTLYMEELWNEPEAVLKAGEALRGIPESSIFHSEALMELSWLAVRSRNWNECTALGYKLFTMDAHRIIRCEGALTAGLGYHKKKDYKRAIYLLEQGINLLEEKNDAGNEKSLGIKEISRRIDNIGKKLGPLAGRKKIDGKAEKVLFRRYQELKSVADERYWKYKTVLLDDLAGERFEELLFDMQFLIADATRKVHNPQDSDRKVESIDKKIEKLQKEMEKLKEP